MKFFGRSELVREIFEKLRISVLGWNRSQNHLYVTGECPQLNDLNISFPLRLPAESEQVNFPTQENHLSHLLVSYLTEDTSSDHLKEQLGA